MAANKQFLLCVHAHTFFSCAKRTFFFVFADNHFYFLARSAYKVGQNVEHKRDFIQI